MKSFSVLALDDFPIVEADDDLSRMIVEASIKNGLSLKNGDIIVIAQKVISKSEGRIAKLSSVKASEKAREIGQMAKKSGKLVELVLRETRRILKISSEALIVRDSRGLISINAGIDKSNVKGRDSYALLPMNPDSSAEKCRCEIKELTGKDVAVVISDTYSRPFRRAQVNFAIGIAGIGPFKDYRGTKDLFGQVLRVKRAAIVDEIAAAAELLMGQGTEATPVIIIRGLQCLVESCGTCSINELYLSDEEDMFRGLAQ